MPEYIKKCFTCGIEFRAHYQSVRYCSEKCRQERQAELMEITRVNTEKRRNAQRHAFPKLVSCRICGEPVLPTYTEDRMCRKQMHEECVVNDAVEAFKQGAGVTDIRYQRAYRNGYTQKDIYEIYRERRMKNV